MDETKIQKPEDTKDELEKKFMCPDKDFFSWDYQKRNIDFMDDFDDETARRFITQIRAYAKEFSEAEDNTINLYINSCGGIVTSLLAMIDAMALVPNDFATICIGQSASCGAVLLSCGTKGKRYITENSRVLIHQVSSGMWGKSSEIKSDAKETERLNKLLLGILAKNCGKTVEELEQLTLGGDLYLTAEEAVEFGIVDAILTKEVIDRFKGSKVAFVPDETPEKVEEDIETKSHGQLTQSALKLEIKAFNEDDKYYYIKGKASTPDADRVDDIVMPEALEKSVKRMGLPAFIHQHNLSGMPLGVCEKVTRAGNDTIVELKMPKDEYSKQIKDRVEMGAYGGLSIGYIARDYEYDAEGYRHIKDLDWFEVSLVTVPANPNAEILEVKQQQNTKEIKYDIINSIKTIRDVEDLLCKLGISKKEAGYVIKVVKSSLPEGEPMDNEDAPSEGEPNKENDHDETIDILNGVLDTLKNFTK